MYKEESIPLVLLDLSQPADVDYPKIDQLLLEILSEAIDECVFEITSLTCNQKFCCGVGIRCLAL